MLTRTFCLCAFEWGILKVQFPPKTMRSAPFITAFHVLRSNAKCFLMYSADYTYLHCMSWQGVGLVWPPDKHHLGFSLLISAKTRSPGCWVAQRRRSTVTRHVISCASLLIDRSLFRISLLFIDFKDLCLFLWSKIDWLVKTTFPKVSSITITIHYHCEF